MTVLYAIPTIALLALAIALAVALTCGGQLLVYRVFAHEDFIEHNDVAGPVVSVVGTLYAVVLGFITVVTWQQYDATRERVAQETASVADAWHNAVGLPTAPRAVLRRDMLAYATDVATDEWPLMRTGRVSPAGDELIMDATSAVGAAVPRNDAQSNAQSATLRLLTDLHDSRARRLATNRSGLSWFEWTVLLIGAFIVITLCLLFGVRNAGAHLVMTGSVGVILAVMFVLIFELQYPFRSDLGIPVLSWTALIEHIHLMDASAMPGMRM